MNIADLRKALIAAVNEVEGLEATGLRENLNPPCALIYPDVPYSLEWVFGEEDSQFPQFRIMIVVPYVDTDDAQDRLDAFLATEGPYSVKEAIENDQTLGGNVTGVYVSDLISYGVVSLRDGGVKYLSAELAVKIAFGTDVV